MPTGQQLSINIERIDSLGIHTALPPRITMPFNKNTVVAGVTLALLVVSFRAEAVSTVPCPLATGTMDCITDSECRTCCINNGSTDGECNGYLWACVCTKGS
ncbi:hypothetical protein PVAP13_8KG242100 [Panicum virgatum]|uniref:Knottins-like domain-containing protein n=1 Tax=Panicum virgatum TaxID=38727 RepID=A0A8T0PXE8_PANVG|nr:hypothetical protein PVAP13_8KG242100 [Panicum virgatum]